MEEKERYVIGKGEDIFIADNDRKVMFTITTKKLQDLLNQQDQRIKELEKVLEDAKLNVGNKVIDMTINQNDLKKENQQLKQQLAESENKRKSLEEKVKFLTEETEENFVDGQKYNELKQQLAITEKALELACETIKQMCGKPLWIGGNIPSPEPKDIKYFKDIAREML